MIWFTSDTHFGHTGILAHSNRPFHTIEQHDEALITAWNRRVEAGDTVYHLGDFAWFRVPYYRARLRGQIHLVRGNHDRLKAADEKLFCSVSDLKKVKVGEQKIYLCHYAMRVWNCAHYGSWHLYGHSHGNLADDPAAHSLDVGVDCRGYQPISFDQIAILMKQKQWKPVDHHTSA